MCTIACSDVLEPVYPCNQHYNLLQSSEDQASFRIQNVQIQEGGVDCGLFAMSIALETTQNVTDDHAWHLHTHCMYNSITLINCSYSDQNKRGRAFEMP